MGKKYSSRRDFFKTLTGQTGTDEPAGGPVATAPAGDDKLFKRYARKSRTGRHYSTDIVETPDSEGGGTTANRVGNVTSSLTAYVGTSTITTGNLSDWEATHLLRRTGFGARYADMVSLTGMTPGAAVDMLLNITSNTPVSPSATPLNHYNSTYPDSTGVAAGADWTGNNLTYAAAGNVDGSIDYSRQTSHTAWQWGVWLNDGITIREKMTAFWYHLIPVNFDDVRNAVYNTGTLCAQYLQLLRSNALGNYQTLIKAIAKNPAMLVYLSGQYSTAAAPNENFGRELLELFMLGKVPTQNYGEDDVKAGAKVLSGWRVTSFTATPFAVTFNPGYHNQTNKIFTAFFGNTQITNISGAGGSAEFDSYFAMLFQYQGTTIAKYIARRMYRYFVYYDIDANVEANVIAPLAAALIANNWDLLPTMKTLFKSQHFFDMANRGVMIKSPVDMVSSVLRMFNVNTTAASGTSQLVNQYAIWQYFQSYCNNNLEQAFGFVPNVSGWKAYYQEPGYYQNWINTNTIQKRASLLTSLVSGITLGGTLVKIDVIAFAQQYPSATIQDPDLLVDAVIKNLLCVDLDATFKTSLKVQNLLQGQVTNSYWTTAWNNYVAAPANTTNLNAVKTRLTNLITAILQLAEFQLM